MDDLRLVIFDFDGTLVDSQEHIVAAMTYAFGCADEILPERARILSIVGLSLHEAMKTLLPGASEERVEMLVRGYRESFLASREAAGVTDAPPLYPGALAELERLAETPSTLMGVATGKARRGLDHVCSVHRLNRFFITLQTSDHHPSKPHPSMMLQALSETGCLAENAVMVGDTEFDIGMGKAAGVATVGVSWGYHPRKRLERAGADVVIDGFPALEGALAGLGNVWV